MSRAQGMDSSDDEEVTTSNREVMMDLFGTAEVETVEQGEAMVAGGRQQLEDALQSMLRNDPDDSDLWNSYDKAKQQSPHLIEIESNPDKFLRFYKYDVWAASEAIAKYWQKRESIFGERAFRPMTLCGEGALNKEEAEAFKCGGFSILPSDKHGRGVALMNRAKFCTKCANADTRLKSVFYLLQVCFESDTTFKNGLVGMILFDTENPNNPLNRPKRSFFNFVMGQIIPITHRACHFIVVRKSSFIQNLIPSWLSVFQPWKERTVVHFAPSKEAAALDLQNYGISGAFIDQDLYFNQWLEERQQIERARYPELAPAASSSASTSVSSSNAPVTREEPSVGHGNDHRAGVPLVAAAASSHESRQPDGSVDEETERLRRKREHDRKYQKRKRAQNKQILEELKDDYDKIKKTHGMLKDEHSFLLSQLERANVLVETTQDREKRHKPPAEPALPDATRKPAARTIPPLSIDQSSTNDQIHAYLGLNQLSLPLSQQLREQQNMRNLLLQQQQQQRAESASNAESSFLFQALVEQAANASRIHASSHMDDQSIRRSDQQSVPHSVLQDDRHVIGQQPHSQVGFNSLPSAILQHPNHEGSMRSQLTIEQQRQILVNRILASQFSGAGKQPPTNR